jgi:transposase
MACNKGQQHLTTEKRAEVVGMAASGSLVLAVARLSHLLRSTVDLILKKKSDTSTVETKKQSGRPRKTTDRDLRQIKSALETNCKAKLSKISEIVPTQVTTRTLQKRIHELGFNNRVEVEKPNINNVQKEKQIKFAQEHLNWTIADWKRVIWTDESSFEIGKNSQVVCVWRTKEQKYDLDCLEPTFKSGRTSTMVWGAFFGTTKAPLVFIPPKSRKAADFIKEVYKPGLVPFLQEHDPNHSRRLVLMEDGAPAHIPSSRRLSSPNQKSIRSPTGHLNPRTSTPLKMSGRS